MNHPITRRESIKKMVRLSGGLALGGMSAFEAFHPPVAGAGEQANPFIVEGIGTRPDYSVKELMKKVFDSAGGIKRFISKGDVVVVKPNISWARTPQMAASTNPARPVGSSVLINQGYALSPSTKPGCMTSAIRPGTTVMMGIIMRGKAANIIPALASHSLRAPSARWIIAWLQHHQAGAATKPSPRMTAGQG